MASGLLAIAIILAAIVVPTSGWMRRVIGTWRSPRYPRPEPPPTPGGVDHLEADVVQLVVASRRVVLAIRHARRVSVQYRKSLPYLDLFFMPDGMPLPPRGWVRETRAAYEGAVAELAAEMEGWLRLARRFEPAPGLMGSVAGAVASLLGDPHRLPRGPHAARRIRYTEEPEVEELLAQLGQIERGMEALEAELREARDLPYR